MVTNGYKSIKQPDPSKEKHETVDWKSVIRDRDLFSRTQTDSVRSFYTEQRHKWIAHTIRRPNNEIMKNLTLHQTKNVKRDRRIRAVARAIKLGGGGCKLSICRLMGMAFERGFLSHRRTLCCGARFPLHWWRSQAPIFGREGEGVNCQ